MACYDCGEGASDSWGRPRLLCTECAENDKRKENDKLLTQIQDLKASLKCLHHKFENELTLGIRHGVDVVIVVQGITDQPLHAHTFILASRSEVFRKIFKIDMQEKKIGSLLIDDATLPVVRAVIKFCYNATIEFTDEVTTEEVSAYKYGIHLLRRICEEDLTATISEGNLPKRLKLARKFMLAGLEAVAFQFFKDNFDELICDVLSEFCGSLRLEKVLD